MDIFVIPDLQEVLSKCLPHLGRRQLYLSIARPKNLESVTLDFSLSFLSSNPISSTWKIDLESDHFSMLPLLTKTKPASLAGIRTMMSFVVWPLSLPHLTQRKKKQTFSAPAP